MCAPTFRIDSDATRLTMFNDDGVAIWLRSTEGGRLDQSQSLRMEGGPFETADAAVDAARSWMKRASVAFLLAQMQISFVVGEQSFVVPYEVDAPRALTTSVHTWASRTTEGLVDAIGHAA